FGTKEEMLQRAEKRVEILRQEGYPEANVYNPQGVGGIHMLYVLPEKPAIYGLPENPQTPDSINLWKDVVRPLGKLAGAGAIVGVLGMAALKGMTSKKEGK
ncbi:MAG: formate dehydrogenase, partial [Selenomonas sp.]|nr:formate dehydrogenase [Selenomonas sp.]